LAGRAGQDHVLRTAAEFIVGRDLIVALDLASQVIDGFEQALTALRLLGRTDLASIDVLYAIARCVGVAGLERLVAAAEERALAEFPGERRIPRYRDIGG